VSYHTVAGELSVRGESPGGGVSPGGGPTLREVLAMATDVVAGPRGTWGSPLRTGFELVDRVLDGGFRQHDLVLLGGAPGVGKTIAALQIARCAATDGHQVVYASYEHDELTMLGRLLALELGDLATPENAVEVDRLRKVVVDATAGFRRLDEVVDSEPLIRQAVAAVNSYGGGFRLVRASGATTDIAALEDSVRATDAEGAELLVVDYLQKVAVSPEPADEAEKITRSAEGLKDLALRRGVAVLALVAADWEGVRSGRVRLHHLRGSSALAYECDVAILLNEKHRAVSKVHLAYDPVRAEQFHRQVVFSIEKNRGGPAMVDLEFRKDFEHYRFDPLGSYLAERLTDDRFGE
jgi:replicative DNA helicase